MACTFYGTVAILLSDDVFTAYISVTNCSIENTMNHNVQMKHYFFILFFFCLTGLFFWRSVQVRR